MYLPTATESSLVFLWKCGMIFFLFLFFGMTYKTVKGSPTLTYIQQYFKTEFLKTLRKLCTK